MRKYIKIKSAFVVLCFACWFFGHAQPGPDSLRKKAEGMQEEEAVAMLGDSARHYLASDPRLSLDYSSALAEFASREKNMNAYTDALVLQGKGFFFLGETDTAKVVCRKAIQLSDSLNDIKRLAEATYFIGVLESTTNDHREGLKSFFQSYRYNLSIADSFGIANAFNAIGTMYFEISIYDSAAYYLLESISIAEKNGYPPILGKAFLNIGLVYTKLEEIPTAKSYLNKSAEINRELNNLVNLAKSYHNLGNIYTIENNLDSAEFLFNKALELNLSMNYPEGIAHEYTGLGELADKRGDYKQSYDYYAKAKHYYELCDNKEGILISFKNMGMTLWRRGNYDAALKVYDSSLKVARKLGLATREVEIYYNICSAYEAKGDFKMAYQCLKIKNALSDSIMNVEKLERIAALKLSYEKEKDRARILELQNKNLILENRNITYLAGGSSVVLIFIFLFAFYTQRSRKNRIIAEQRIRQLEEEKKFLAARSIVEGQEEERKRIASELHDGLGVLLSSAKMHFTSLRDKTPEAQPLLEKAAKLLEQATGDVRRISHNMMPGLLTKFGLYEAVQELFEQVDELEELHAEVAIRGEQNRLKQNTEIMLYRIIQEMVNNSLKHAAAANIKLDIEILPEKIRFSYSDDGKGFDAEAKLKEKSMGLVSIQSRVKYLGGELQIQSSEGKGVAYDFEIQI